MIEYLKKLSWKIYRTVGFDPLTTFIQEIAPKSPEVLDIGCESGNNIRKCLLVRDDLNISAVDLMDRSKELPAKVTFIKLDVTFEKLPFDDEKFDAITCIHLIEHISTFENLLQEMYRVLRKGGKLYIETPSFRRLFLPSFRFRLSEKPHVPFNFLDDYTHTSLFTFGKLYYLLEDSSFEVEKLRMKRNVLSLILSPVLIPLGLILRRRKLIASSLHSIIGASIYAIAKKA